MNTIWPPPAMCTAKSDAECIYFLCHGGSIRGGGSYQINSLMYQLSNYFSLTSWLLRMCVRGVPLSLKEPIFIIVSWLLDALIPLLMNM